jgi:hypothetical protein
MTKYTSAAGLVARVLGAVPEKHLGARQPALNAADEAGHGRPVK